MSVLFLLHGCSFWNTDDSIPPSEHAWWGTQPPVCYAISLPKLNGNLLWITHFMQPYNEKHTWFFGIRISYEKVDIDSNTCIHNCNDVNGNRNLRRSHQGLIWDWNDLRILVDLLDMQICNNIVCSLHWHILVLNGRDVVVQNSVMSHELWWKVLCFLDQQPWWPRWSSLHGHRTWSWTRASCAKVWTDTMFDLRIDQSERDPITNFQHVTKVSCSAISLFLSVLRLSGWQCRIWACAGNL